MKKPLFCKINKDCIAFFFIKMHHTLHGNKKSYRQGRALDFSDNCIFQNLKKLLFLV